jgi:predicted PurR-regulated permease PerM
MASAVMTHRVLIGLVLVAAALLLVVLSPFGKPLLVAAALAGALHGLQERLTRRLRGRRKLAATLLVVGVLFAGILPLGGLVTYAVRESLQVAESITRTVQGGGTEALIVKLPQWLQGVVRRVVEELQEAAQRSEGLMQPLSGSGSQAVVWLGGAVVATTVAIVKVVLLLIALFFLLVDGPRLVSWIEQVAPLAPGQARVLLHEFQRATSAVIRSTILTAFAQSTVAYVGFLIARAPQPLFLALVTFLFALVPVAGAAFVTVTTGVIFLLTGHLAGGIFLCAWGLLAVGLVDNVVKPLVIKGGVEVHAGLIFFVLVGGLMVFGPVGLIVGPLALSFFLAVVRLAHQSAPEPPRIVGAEDGGWKERASPRGTSSSEEARH